MKNITRIGLILTMAILTSCSLLGSEDQDETETEESGYTEREFYDKIQRSLNSRNWQVAIGNLQLLESQFPFGKYAEQAQLELIYAQHMTSDHESSIAAAERSVKRVYQAVANGLLTGSGVVDQPIGRHPRQRIKMAVVSDGKEARTHYSVLQRFHGHSHIKLQLETGRTHQIRVHMAHLNHPLVGDSLYAGRFKIQKGTSAEFIDFLRNFERQALHAAELALIHPHTGEEVSWSSPLPADFEALLARLGDEQSRL